MSFNKVSSRSQARGTAGKVAALAAALGTLSLCLAMPASAADRETTVQFEDLDLAREQDVKQLYRRLQRASEVVCQKNNGRELYQRRRFKECYEEALERAVAGVDAVQLTKLHDSRDTLVAQRRRVPNES